MDFIFAVILFAVIGVGIAFFAARNQSRCPKCGKHALQRTGSRLVSRVNGVKTEDVTYTCKNCGNTIIRRQQSYDSDYHNRGVAEAVRSSADLEAAADSEAVAEALAAAASAEEWEAAVEPVHDSDPYR